MYEVKFEPDRLIEEPFCELGTAYPEAALVLGIFGNKYETRG